MNAYDLLECVAHAVISNSTIKKHL